MSEQPTGRTGWLADRAAAKARRRTRRREKLAREIAAAKSTPGWRGWVTPMNVLGIVSILAMVTAILLA